MSLNTFSKFYYGQTITAENNLLNFREGVDPEKTATLNVGEYTLDTFATEIKRALDDEGTQTYTVTVDRVTRKITISAPGTFSLLVSTGSQVGTSPFSLIGFNGADRTGATTYTGDSASGYEYKPQFVLQDHIPSSNWRQAADASVKKAASGRVEITKFGTEKFVQFSIKFSTDIPQPTMGPIRNDPNGVGNLQDFMNYLITKAPIEFMEDESDVNTFETLILESSPDSTTGTGFKLKELYDRRAAGYFETPILKMRLIE